MTDECPAAIVVGRSEVVRLAELMDDLDRLFRGQPNDEIWAVLRAHAERPGQPDPGYLIDMVSLTAARLHRLLDAVDDGGPIS
jgi:hypothetical protein